MTDWVSLSFVRRGEDIRVLKRFLSDRGAVNLPVMAKIEKPQAIANIDEIILESDGLMVARYCFRGRTQTRKSSPF